MKRWMRGLILTGFAMVMGVGVAYSQGSSGASSSAQEALKKGSTARDNKNYDEADKWYRIAANQGNAEAQSKLGELLLDRVAAMQLYNTLKGIKDGPEIASKAKEGFDWVLKSAEQGYAEAQYSVGYQYYNGTHFIAQDKEKGLIWLRKATAHGNEDATKFLREEHLSP